MSAQGYWRDHLAVKLQMPTAGSYVSLGSSTSLSLHPPSTKALLDPTRERCSLRVLLAVVLGTNGSSAGQWLALLARPSLVTLNFTSSSLQRSH